MTNTNDNANTNTNTNTNTNETTTFSAHRYTSDYTGEERIALVLTDPTGRRSFPQYYDEPLTTADIETLDSGRSIVVRFCGEFWTVGADMSATRVEPTDTNETTTAFGVWSASFFPATEQRVRIRSTLALDNGTGRVVTNETGRIVALYSVEGFCAAKVELDNGGTLETVFGIDVEPVKSIVVEFEFESDDSPGGTIASYGAGVAFTEFDSVYFGSGRNEREACENAIESFVQSVDSVDKWAVDRMESAAGDFTDDESPVEDFETECFREFCLAEGIDFENATDDDRQRFYDLDDGLEIVAVLRVRFASEPETVEEVLARHVGCDVDDVAEQSCDFYGLRVFEADGAEYAIGTDLEADAAARESARSYLEECVEIPDGIRSYFDEEKWINDAILSDGRAHVLSSYDGIEHEIRWNGEWFFIYRTN